MMPTGVYDGWNRGRDIFREATNELCDRIWRRAMGGDKVVAITSAAIVYVSLCGLAKANSSPEKSHRLYTIPVNDVLSAKGTYNKYIDERLKFITATISTRLKDACDARGDISWDTMHEILSNCPELEESRNGHVNKEETFPLGGKITNDEMKDLIIRFVKSCQTNVVL